MIDTDKYEGHNGPWEITEYIDEIRVNESKRLELNAIDASLIADAPLLLAEVKELRRQIRVAQGVFEYLYHDELEDAYWIRWFCNMESEEE